MIEVFDKVLKDLKIERTPRIKNHLLLIALDQEI